ncbi:hypothetical protein [Microbacterium sp. W4I20]|uniref:hypothetical protein n=1 Tax=Microbacterium sp. W4I20 TaxID=3042262 RepID=UPI0027862DCB|nr:hypothetical protein [Microbacterium sp. W4I20]MDQ0726831.1 hypothetical protein [Microbacterium sp. W4I20]
MNDYTPSTEEIREYVETGGEPRPWVELDEAEEALEKSRGEAFDRWLAAHDREVAATSIEKAITDAPRAEIHVGPNDWREATTIAFLQHRANAIRTERRADA